MPKLQGVYRAGNGSWYFKATLGRDPLSGKRPGHQAEFATATDAARARRELLEQADGGSGAPRASLSMTVGQLLDEYLDGIDTDGRLSPKTRHDYRRNADAYVRPWLGEHRVRALTPEAILAWQRQLSEGTGTRRGRPLAPNTVRLARASLAGAVRLAVESGVLRTNPLASVQQPKARRSTPRHWLPEQAREFLASQAGHRLYPLWAFLLGSGLRIGELVWLRWRRTIRAGESQAIPPSVVHSVDVPDGAVLSVDFLTRPWRHQEAPPGGATWR